ncbi:MAG: transporter substrate-binding domain-containing protein [Kangiellaceae bacterium]|nr:transporter substrate-binding domain-containing protein [Kangiellaceae bacterium]
MVPTTYADKIILAADYWCPINCQPESSQEGFMVDIAKRIFKENGHQVKYIIVPWNRTIRMVRAGKIHGAIGPYIEDSPDFIFPENELAMIGFSVFVKKNSNWNYSGISSLEKLRLGVVANYSYGEELDLYIEKNKDNVDRIHVIHGDTPVKQNMKMLLYGRIDAIVATQPVFLHVSNKSYAKAQFRLAGEINSPKKAYIAFSPALPTSKRYAKILSDGISELRKSGELTEILSKYGLYDWKN